MLRSINTTRSRTSRVIRMLLASTMLSSGAPLAIHAAPPFAVAQDPNPATFSVRGPVDPNTEGILFPRGGPIMPQAPVQPGNPLGFGIRTPASAAATGIATPFPGDVADYAAIMMPDEAVFFQSEPVAPGPPSGNNNQILETTGAGLVSGPAVPPPSWITAPPRRDDVDAISFGQDYFSPAIGTGFDPSTAFALPPMGGGPFGPKVAVAPSGWAARGSIYREPMIIADGAGQRFLFSVDAWAVGAVGTWVESESGGFDVGGGLGPWTSPGAAAGDVFTTPIISRAGGVTVGGGMNFVEDNNPMLALAPPVGRTMTPREDDLDGLERVGPSNDWLSGAALASGSIVARTMPVMPVPAAPGVSSREPANSRPVFFSVKRNSTGIPMSAVWSQFVNDGGAASDIFVTAKNPTMAAGVGTNLLFADEAELGLLAIDASAGGTGAADYCDNLDALMLNVSPAYRPVVVAAIDEIMGGAPFFVMGGAFPWAAGPMGSMTGGGMTISILQYLRMTGRPMTGPTDVQCAFSVSTDAIGMEFSAVDYEAGSVGVAGGPSTAAGDIFYATLDGTPTSGNWLWHEGMAIGLDEGVYVPGFSMDLKDLGDNLDALDADVNPPSYVRTDVGEGIGAGGDQATSRRIEFLPGLPNPFRDQTAIRYSLPGEQAIHLAVFDVTGKLVRTLFDGRETAGEHSRTWDGHAAAGERAAPGIYFARLRAGTDERTSRVVMLK